MDHEVVIAPGIKIMRRCGYQCGYSCFGIGSTDEFLVWGDVVWAIFERDCVVAESFLRWGESYFVEVWVAGGVIFPHKFI